MRSLSAKAPSSTETPYNYRRATVKTESEAPNSRATSAVHSAEGSRYSTKPRSDCDYCEGQPRGAANNSLCGNSDVWGLNDGASKPTTPTGWTDVDARRYGNWGNQGNDLEDNSSNAPMCWNCGRCGQGCVCSRWDIAPTPTPTRPRQKPGTWSDVCSGAGGATTPVY